MCGLCGVIELDRPPDRETVDAWLDGLAHRGPDGRGVFADDGVCLGHLRLAIIDLSDAGLQPMTRRRAPSPAQRRDLQLPRATRRTAREGSPVLDRDRQRGDPRRLPRVGRAVRRALQRHVGVRHLGRAEADALLLARPARDEALLLPARRPPVRVRERAVGAAAGRRRTSAPSATISNRDTSTRATRRSSTVSNGCAPAHSLTFGPDGAAVLTLLVARAEEPADGPGRRDPRDVPRRGAPPASERRARRHVPLRRNRLVRDRRRRSRITGTTHQKTVTAYFDDPGLRRAAVRARRGRPDRGRTALGLLRRRRRSSTDLPAIVHAQGEPFGSTSICAGWYVMREARRAGLTVMLDGQGGDEIFAGYRASFGYRFVRSHSRRKVDRGDRTSCGRSRTTHGPRWAAVALATPHVPERVRLECAREAARSVDARRTGAPRRGFDRVTRTARSSRTGCVGSCTARSRSAACPSCSATRTATRWRTRSRRACRCSTIASSSSRSRSTARS